MPAPASVYAEIATVYALQLSRPVRFVLVLVLVAVRFLTEPLQVDSAPLHNSYAYLYRCTDRWTDGQIFRIFFKVFLSIRKKAMKPSRALPRALALAQPQPSAQN